ncbi:MAG: DNA adenine methylase [Candidatus Sumerlaeota bacterium]
MAQSSTSYTSKWRCGKTCVIRVPEKIADNVLDYAHDLDAKVDLHTVNEEGRRYMAYSQMQMKGLSLERPVNVASVPQRSLFRYPGGKTWLIPKLRVWLMSMENTPDLFLEPFAGGGIASLTVAFEGLARHVVLAETDEGVSAVWRTLINGQGEWLAEAILDYKLTLENVKKSLAKDIPGKNIPLKERAFLTILRNRVQRGGIMAPGAGLVKKGENNRGIASRWYPETLAKRIRNIGNHRERMSFYQGDGFDLIDDYIGDATAAIYLDPPYVKAAKRLYRNWKIDHRKLFEKMAEFAGPFLMSYDNNSEIREMASEFGFECRPVSMKNTHHAKMKELLISKDIRWLDEFNQ